MRKSLEFRVLAVVGGVLLLGAVVGALITAYMQKATLYSVTETANENTAEIILKEIETTMLEGKADVTRSLVRNLKEIRDLEEITVFDPEGREAFQQNAPVAEADVLGQLKAGKPSVLKKDKTRLTYYLPFRNLPSCQKCHDAQKTLLGAAKVSVSVEKEYKKSLNSVMTVAGASLVAALAFSFVLWLMVRRLVISPVKLLSSAAGKIAEGDLSCEGITPGEDELGRLGKAFKQSCRTVGNVFERTRQLSGRIAKVSDDVEKESKSIVRGSEVEVEAISNIAGSVEELNGTAIKIADGTDALATSVEETSTSMEEMVSNINNVNESIHELSIAVESTSSSIEELSATIKEVASNAEELAGASEETLSAVSEITSAIKEVEVTAKESARLSEKVTSDAATLGMVSVEKTMEGMKNIKSSVEHTAEFIAKLGGRSDEIGKILTVIDEVTDQTTLLALNAAILAAQAGEHGKGFSVVADEIKDLAERTAFSTKEIALLIQAVQQEVKNSAEAMQEGLRSVEEGFRLSREAGDSLRKILGSSKHSSEMAISIERSTTEQSKAARLVAEAMERVRNMTDQIAKATAEESKGILLIIKATEKMRDAAQHVSRATEEQTIGSRQISEAIDVISEKTQQIARSLSEHKIETQHILNTVDGVKSIPAENRKLAFKFSGALRNLHNDAELLKMEMERFKYSDDNGGGEERKDLVRLGVLPLDSPAVMFRKFIPLAEYLTRKLGKTVELKVAVDFESALRDIGQNVTQLCAMGPATYVEGSKKYGLKVLVKALRNGKPYHHSVIIAREDSSVKSLGDLRGKTFAFADAQSSTGHIIPRAMLKEAGVSIEDLQYYQYLGHHDEVARSVLKGDFDAGAVMEATAQKFVKEGLKILQVSDNIPEFNVCYNVSVAGAELTVIREALISLKNTTAEGSLILKSIGKDCTGFVAGDDSDYEGIKTKMAKLGII
ncbi:MAG: phosphate/phosphite/phosphonate ABC transporter substrate-binding protein [Nitrospirae bacterium]|nr:phosphate/phosphite/phosphonate ABC transporter substrate-binding protein [Nitrospirota bacterium]